MELNKFLLLLILFTIVNFSHAKNIALLIGVGDYPKSSGWHKISAANDVLKMKNTFLSRGFKEKDIYTLINEQATKIGIINFLKRANNLINEGDQIILYFSAHGQQVFDSNKDELDGLDEAIIAYNGQAAYSSSYAGEGHLLDDELEPIINNYRLKLGKNGFLVVITDSCYSSTSTRGVARGRKPALVPNEVFLKKDKLLNNTQSIISIKDSALNNSKANYVFLSSSLDNQLSYDYQDNGAFTKAFTKVLNTTKDQISYDNLFTKIVYELSLISPQQTPTIEGNTSFNIFSLGKKHSLDRFTIIDIESKTLVAINAGKLQGVFSGSEVLIEDLRNGKKIKGVVTSCNDLVSEISLTNQLPEIDNLKRFTATITKRSSPKTQYKIFLSVDDETIKNNIASSEQLKIKRNLI